MKRLYLYTKSEDRANGPIQKPMAEGEVRELYVDNERVATLRAIQHPSGGISCSGCYLRDLRTTVKTCMIPVKHAGGTALGGFCCGSEKVILKT